jgi:hypothetical protein
LSTHLFKFFKQSDTKKKDPKTRSKSLSRDWRLAALNASVKLVNPNDTRATSFLEKISRMLLSVVALGLVNGAINQS